MRRIALTVAYDGTHWCGSQRQNNGPTIQGEIERVLAELLKAATPVTLAGRTDAGVHAHGQVAAFDLSGECPTEVKLRLQSLEANYEQNQHRQRHAPAGQRL